MEIKRAQLIVGVKHNLGSLILSEKQAINKKTNKE